MLYLFFDTAVNGYYALSLLRNEFQNFVPLLPAEENIEEGVAPFVFDIDQKQFDAFLSGNTIVLKEVVLINAPVLLAELQMHFRQFVVQSIKGRQFYFRFWCANVLKKYLSTCNSEQLQSFFGPVQQFILQAENRSTFNLYALKDERLIISTANGNATLNLNNASSIKQEAGKYDIPAGGVTVELNARRPARKFFD